MAAHLAGERRAGFLQLLLDEGMSGFPHHGNASVPLDPWRQVPRAFHVKYDRRSRISRKNIGCEHHEQPIGVDDAAVLRDHAEPVAVAVEREPELSLARGERL